MSAKEASGTKKDKSFNGSKAKYSPNPPVPDKKEVKLRRKESEKVKQPNDSTRKSVLGRFFHNLVDSDDSRKKNASADAKKKKGARDLEGSGGDLDLPEHGIILRKSLTLQRNAEPIPNPRVRASTLSNQGQGRDNRNRWSSYDIHGTNFMEALLPPPVLLQDSAALGVRSQSDETLNADQNASKFLQNFETANRTDAKRELEMRKHVQSLKTIQETQANRTMNPERMSDLSGSQAANGWLLSAGDVVSSGLTNAVRSKDVVQKSNVVTNASLDVPGSDGCKKSGSKDSSSSLVLLQEKSKEIDKALNDKRKIMSSLFKTSEKDMDNLVEKDVKVSEDLTIRKMILISILQSDRLTSVINSLLVSHKNASPVGVSDKDVSHQKDDDEQRNNGAFDVQSLQLSAIRLQSDVKLLMEMVNRDVHETDCLRKEVELAENRLKQKKEKNLQEIKLTEDHEAPSIRQGIELNSSAEVHDHGNEQLNKELELRDSIVVKEPADIESKSPSSTDEAATLNSKSALETDELSTDKKDLERDAETLNCADSTKPPNEAHVDSDILIDDGDDKGLRQDEYIASDFKTEPVIPSTDSRETTESELEALSTPSSNEISNTISPVEKILNSESEFQPGGKDDIPDDDLSVSTTEVDTKESCDLNQSNVNRICRSLVSIPEDDDKLSACDGEQKVPLDATSNDGVAVEVAQISVDDGSDENICLSLDTSGDELVKDDEGRQSFSEADNNSEVNGVCESKTEVDTSLIFGDCIQSDVHSEGPSTLRDGALSDVGDVVCGLQNCPDSDVEAVPLEVKMPANDDQKILDEDISLCKETEKTSKNLSAELVDSSGVNIVEFSIEKFGITADEKEQETKKSVEKESSEVDRGATEKTEESLESENDNNSDSGLQCNGETEATSSDDATFLNSDSDQLIGPCLSLDMEGNMETDDEIVSKPIAEVDFELPDAAVTENAETNAQRPVDNLVMEISSSDIIPEDLNKTQLNKDSIFEGVSEDQNGNEEVKHSCIFLNKDNDEECVTNETVEIDGKSCINDVEKTSDLSICDRT